MIKTENKQTILKNKNTKEMNKKWTKRKQKNLNTKAKKQ